MENMLGELFLIWVAAHPQSTITSPGRFFAANELKAMMAHIVISYDIKFENEGIRPPNVPFSLTLIPAPTAKVLFRKRTV